MTAGKKRMTAGKKRINLIVLELKLMRLSFLLFWNCSNACSLKLRRDNNQNSNHTV